MADMTMKGVVPPQVRVSYIFRAVMPQFRAALVGVLIDQVQ
jgi:hypothetical protein